MALLRYNLHAIQFTHLKCTSHWVLAYSQSCIAIIIHNFGTFLSPLLRNLITISNYFPSPSSSYSWMNTHLFSVSMNFPILDISDKRNHTIHNLCYCLFSVSIMFSRFACVVAVLILYSFLGMSNIPVYVYNIFCLSIHQS